MSQISTSVKGMLPLVLVTLVGLTAQAQTPDGDWTTYNRTYSGERYSPLKEINTSNVVRLRTICTYDTGETVAFQTGPLVVGGVMFFTTFRNTYAIDAATCALKWKNEHPVAKSARPATHDFNHVLLRKDRAPGPLLRRAGHNVG